MSIAPTWAIVPVKSLADAKQRLAGVLPLKARRRLMLTMLQDVLAVLRGVELLQPVLVVTPDAHAAEVAEDFGARVLRETECRGHSAAVIAGFAEAQANGAVQALTLPADAPLVTPGELRVLLEAVGLPSPLRGGGGGESPRLRGETQQDLPPQLTLVPSRNGDGTNAVLTSPPDAFAPIFGPGSFARHQSLAVERGIAHRVVRLPGLGMDVDEPGDLRRLIQAKLGDPRYAFLHTHCGDLLERMDHP